MDFVLPLFACDCVSSSFVYETVMVGWTNDCILPLLSGSGWQVKERGGGRDENYEDGYGSMNIFGF